MLAFATYIPQPLPCLKAARCLAEASFSTPRPPHISIWCCGLLMTSFLPRLDSCFARSFSLVLPVVGRWLGGSSHSWVHARCHCWLHVSFNAWCHCWLQVSFGGLRHSWLHVSFGGLRFGGPGLLAARFVRGHAGSSPFLRAGYIRQEPLPWHLETA